MCVTPNSLCNQLHSELRPTHELATLFGARPRSSLRWSRNARTLVVVTLVDVTVTDPFAEAPKCALVFDDGVVAHVLSFC